jgi:hypothetical protein
MRFTLIWHPSAIDDLVTIWRDAPDRRAITEAADAIDPALRTDPVLRGETLAGSIRIFLSPPLEVAYRVFDDDRVVQILSIRRAPPEAEDE